MSKNTLVVNTSLTVECNNPYNICLVVRDNSGIIALKSVMKRFTESYKTRQDVINNINELFTTYSIDTIILEENKLLLDKMDKYPDPLIFKNIQLTFGIQISIEDNFYTKVDNIIALPDYIWKSLILNKYTKYSIDLYKSHIVDQYQYQEYLETIEKDNYYRAICLSESSSFDILMTKKYQINKGD